MLQLLRNFLAVEVMCGQQDVVLMKPDQIAISNVSNAVRKALSNNDGRYSSRLEASRLDIT